MKVLNLILIFILFGLFLSPTGADKISFADNQWTAYQLTTILMMCVTVILTALAVIIGVAAIWGFNAIKNEAKKAASEKAKAVASEEAREIASHVAFEESYKAQGFHGSQSEDDVQDLIQKIYADEEGGGNGND